MGKSSSSSSWLVALLLGALAATVIVGMNQAKHSSRPGSKSGEDEKPGFFENLVSDFRSEKKSPEKKAAGKPQPAGVKQADVSKQKDALERRDRKELNELLDKVGQ